MVDAYCIDVNQKYELIANRDKYIMNHLVNKYKNIPDAAKASLWFMICSILQKGLAFIAIPIYTRLLTTTEYGTFSVYNAWFSLASVFATLSISSEYYVIAVLKNNLDSKRMLSILQGCSIACTSAFFAAIYIFCVPVMNITGLNFVTLSLMFVQVLFSTPILFLTRKQQYEFKFKLIVSVTLAMSVLTIVMSLLMINVLPDKSNSLILGAATVQIAFGIALFIYNQVQGRKFYDKQIWKEAIRFCVPLVPHNLAYFVLNSSDRVMIDRMCNTSDAGIYALASQISIAIGIVTNALSASLNPWVLRKLKQRNFSDIANVMNKLAVWVGAIIIVASLVVPDVLWITTSSEYHEAKWVMPPIMLGAYFLFIGGIPCWISLFHENQKNVAIASSMAAIVNIVLNCISIPTFGYIAVAYTTMISYGGFAIFHYIMAYRQSKKYKYEESVFNYRILGITSIFVSIISLIIMTLYTKPMIRYTIVCIFIIIVFINKDKIKEMISNLRR